MLERLQPKTFTKIKNIIKYTHTTSNPDIAVTGSLLHSKVFLPIDKTQVETLIMSLQSNEKNC